MASAAPSTQVLVRVLIVEDSLTQRRDCHRHVTEYTKQLRQLDAAFDIVDVESLADAKTRLEADPRTQPFDLIILDLEIPLRSRGTPRLDHGLNVITLARKIDPATRIVVLSEKLEEVSLASTARLISRDLDRLSLVPKGNLQPLDEYVEEAVHRRRSIAEARECEAPHVARSTSLIHESAQEETILSEDWGQDYAHASDALFATRIRDLTPYADRSIVHSFGLCFSQCLREVERGSDTLQERLGLDRERDSEDPRMQPLLDIDHSLETGRHDWADLQTSLQLDVPASTKEVSIREVIDGRDDRPGLRQELGPCLAFSGVALSDSSKVADKKVISFGDEVKAILREMILGGLAKPTDPTKGIEFSRKGMELRLSSHYTDSRGLPKDDGDWLAVVLSDNLPLLSPDHAAAINEGAGIYYGDRFSRVWGLSVMQQVALLSGGRLKVESTEGKSTAKGNTIIYRIPRARND